MSDNMRSRANTADILDAVQKVKALVRASQACEPMVVRERLAKEAAEAHVLVASAGTKFDGIQGGSAVVVAAMQLAAAGVLQVVGSVLFNETCRKEGDS